MYSADGFVKSVMASLDSRFKAYDQAVMRTMVCSDKDEFDKLEQGFYMKPLMLMVCSKMVTPSLPVKRLLLMLTMS